MFKRFVGQRFHGHDDRFEDHVRRVSFQNNQGRIGKNKHKWSQIRDRLGGWEEDADMESGRAPNNARTGYGRRGRGPKTWTGGQEGGPRVTALKRAYWYQITVVNGSRYARTEILSKIESYIAPQKFHPVCYQIWKQDSVFYVERWQMAQLLLSCTRKITLGDGQLMVLKIKEGRPPMTSVDNVMIDKMKTAMAKRYVAENKALDLTRFVRDPEFIDGLYCGLNRTPVLRAAFNIVNENIPDLVALNLTGNNIHDMADSEVQKLKSLRILHLGENNITNLNLLNCFKEMEISELVLERNPVVNHFSDRTHFVRYGGPGITEVQKRFPKLTKLDDTELMPIVTFDVADDTKLPSPQAAFICHADGRAFVKAFLSQYYQIYDSENRMELAQAYAENAVFSVTSAYASITPTNNPRLNAYFSESRNLLRVTQFPRRKSLLRTGRQDIVEFLFKQLPKSQHDLLSFVVDLPFFTPDLISLNVSGLFRETGVGSSANWPLRHFSRTFLIVPMGSGFCIVNEMLFVTNATDEQAQVAFKEAAPIATASSTPQASSPSVPVVDDAVKLQMVQAVSQQTGMNIDWSRKCLEETEWNFERAAWTFNELHQRGAIPAEAFIK